MFEMFTDRARRVVVLAQEEARMLNHKYIGTEHLLLGIIHEGEGVAAKAMETLGISLEDARRQVEDIIGRGQLPPGEQIPLTPRAKKALELSVIEAHQIGHDYIGTEHILLGLIREGAGVAALLLVRLGADLDRARQQVIRILSSYSGGLPPQAAGPAGQVIQGFSLELTQQVQSGQINPVVARDRLLERIMLVLARPTGSHPVLVGAPGTGRTALLHGLAERILSGRAPDNLPRDLKIYLLAPNTLPATPAEAAQALATMRQALADPAAERLVVVFDDLDRLTAGLAAELDLFDYLRGLADGSHGVILVSTPTFWNRFGADLGPRFVPVAVGELTVRETAEVLSTLRESYQVRHQVTIDDEALIAAAEHGGGPDRDRPRPGGAFELLEEAALLLRIRRTDPPAKLWTLADKVAGVRRDKESAIDSQDFDRAAQLRDEEKLLLRDHAQVERGWIEANPGAFLITRNVIEDVIEARTGFTPVIELPPAARPPIPTPASTAIATMSRPVAPAVTTVTSPGPPVMLPVRDESVAILLGASRFRDPHLGDVPAVSRNLMDLSAALGQSGGLFDPHRVHYFDQLDHHDLARVDELAQSATDTLLVYYSGHGINAADDLYLAYPTTVSSRPQISALAYDKLRHIVVSSPARRCIIILDCCYAGKAIGWMSGDDVVPGGELDVRGSYLLTATAATVKALAPENERNSAFTAAILRLLRDGVDNGSEFIQVQELHPHLHADLRSRSLPLPRQRPVDTIGALAFARNPRWRAAA